MSCARIKASTHGSVLALGIFPKYDHVDVASLFAGQGRFHAWMKIGGADTNPLVEAATHGQQQAMQGDVVGDVGVTNRAEQDGVKGFQCLDAIYRHEIAGFAVVFRAPGELGELKAESVGHASHSLEGFSAFVDDL